MRGLHTRYQLKLIQFNYRNLCADICVHMRNVSSRTFERHMRSRGEVEKAENVGLLSVTMTPFIRSILNRTRVLCRRSRRHRLLHRRLGVLLFVQYTHTQRIPIDMFVFFTIVLGGFLSGPISWDSHTMASVWIEER